MTILYLGSGLDSLTPSDSAVTEDSSGGTQDLAFTRSASVVPASSYADTPAWTAVQEVWVHAVLEPAIGTYFYLLNGSTANFKLVATGTYLQMYYLSALATWTQIGSNVTYPYNTQQYVDIYFKTGASGAVGLYLGGTERTTATGSYTYSADVTGVRFVGEGDSCEVAGIAVADEPTIGWRVTQGYMSGAGADTAWTGDYTSVDEAELNDADFLNSTSAGQVETFTATFPTLTGYTPRAVCVSARARRGASGPQGLQLALRSSGTNYFSATKTLGLGYTAVQNIWETNPATSADFLLSQIASLQPGVKSVA